MLVQAFTWRDRVQWRHVDPQGFLHFAAIYRFFETAEMEFFRHLDFDPMLLHPGLPRVHCEANFLAPIRFDDLIDTRVLVDSVGRSSFRLLFEVERSGTAVANGTTTIVQLEHESGQVLPLSQGLKLETPLRDYQVACNPKVCV